MKSLRPCLALLAVPVLAVLVLAACELPELPELPDPEDSPPSTPPDHSYKVEKYYELGVQRIDRPWTASDYSQAAAVLARVAQADATRLPRKVSYRSGALFAKLVSADFLQLAERGSGEKATERQQRSDAVAELHALYGLHSESTGPFGSEIADLTCLLTRSRFELARAGASDQDLTQAFSSAIERADPEKGLGKYDRRRLVGCLLREAAALPPSYPASQRSLLVESVDAALEEETDRWLREKLSEARGDLEKGK